VREKVDRAEVVLRASRPPSTCHDALHEARRPCIADRVDVDVLVNHFLNGSIIKDLAGEYEISESSVKRLLRASGTRKRWGVSGP